MQRRLDASPPGPMGEDGDVTVSATRLFVLVALSWIAIGLVASFVMGRRGHSPFAWGLVGAILGPLVLLLAVSRMRQERDAQPKVVSVGEVGQGPIDVLVGVDGSPESTAALDAVVHLLGPRIGRLTLATVVEYDVALSAGGPAQREVEAELRRLAQLFAEEDPDTEILAGRPAQALAERAASGGYHLLAIGSRGRGASKAVLGSVATSLARTRGIPVLLAGGGPVSEGSL
jgi:nucleotide-binding universal stress UspA family protein